MSKASTDRFAVDCIVCGQPVNLPARMCPYCHRNPYTGDEAVISTNSQDDSWASFIGLYGLIGVIVFLVWYFS